MLIWSIAGGRNHATALGTKSDPELVRCFQHWLRLQRGPKLLISAEGLSIFSEKQWQLLAEFLQPYLAEGAKVNCLLLTRHPISWSISLRNQTQKYGRLFDDDQLFAEHTQLLVDLPSTLEKVWSNSVELHVVKVEDWLQKGGLVEQFKQWLGMPPTARYVSSKGKNFNVSIPIESRWAIAEAAKGAAFNLQDFKVLHRLSGTKDGLMNDEVNEVHKSAIHRVNRLLVVHENAPYTEKQRGQILRLETLWPEQFLSSLKEHALWMSRNQCMQLAVVLHQISQRNESNWPTETQARLEQVIQFLNHQSSKGSTHFTRVAIRKRFKKGVRYAKQAWKLIVSRWRILLLTRLNRI